MKALATADGRAASVKTELGARLLAGLAAVVWRYADRSELLLGYVEAGGREPLPVPLNVDGDPTFSELTARAAEALAAAPAHTAAHLDAVVSHDGTVRLGDGSPAEEERLTAHVRTLLGGAAEHPGSPISALPILTAQEREQLLVKWNETGTPFPRRCLHELLAAEAACCHGRLAVECDGERLSFGELDARSTKLARHLAKLGVHPGDLVAVAVERCAEMVAALLGVLKAGAAYVPVDPSYPAARQAFMLKSSCARVVLTQERLVGALPVGEATIVCVDRDWPAIAEQPTEPLGVASDPEQLAYVIYTSGSTGEPKGVEIPHRALVNFLTSMLEHPGLGADDVLVAVTTLSFDIAGLELYLPLLAGGRVVVAPGQTVADPRALSQLLDSSAATVMQATPTTWRMLLDFGWRPHRPLKALCGGEPLPVALAERMHEAGLELWNMYGPTETTIWSTCARLEPGRPLTIGRPIANTTIYILGKHLEPVPAGVAGELWIGGAGLARGYRGRDDLTAERFLTHAQHGRIYRTGDLARYRSDGEIEFLGRIDNQVKVRGFRIELGEIETALTRHPGVAEAVVVALAADGADAELAAYVIARDEPVPAQALREFVAGTLPAYMVPATVTTLDSFPLTPNGKIDRKALPGPQRERGGERALVAPRTKLERRLAAIWERELRLSPIGVTDDFFDLGVSSLTAATLFAAIEHDLGGELPLGAIFRAPTIESLAQMLAQSAADGRWTSLVPIQPHGSRPPVFCVHGGAGTILHLAALSRRLGAEQPFYALQSRGLYGGVPPLTTVEEMAAHYLSEMRQVQPRGPWYLSGYCFGAIVAFDIATRLQAEGEQVRLLAMFNGPSPEWIKRWGGYDQQPGWRERHPGPAPPDPDQLRRTKRARRMRRLGRAARNPGRLWSGLLWELREPMTRLALALGRPVPEQHREDYFLKLHAEAQRAYEPGRYDGRILMFYGEGLYENPTLGWEPFASGGVESHAVPGDHTGNREAMMEPAVGFVAERLAEYLERGS